LARTLFVQPRAQLLTLELAERIDNDNPQAAKQFLVAIFATLEFIAENPAA